MWYVNKLFDQAQVEGLASKGFTVRSSAELRGSSNIPAERSYARNPPAATR